MKVLVWQGPFPVAFQWWCVMPMFKRTQKIEFSAPPSAVLKLIQDEPLKHLEIIGVQVEESEIPESGNCTGELN